MIIAIGNAPSSGSTFLADLLDSLPFAVCGPEINLFSVKSLFTNFNSIKINGLPSSRSAVIYSQRQRLLEERLFNYGINKTLFNTIITQANSFIDFSNKIFSIFSTFRDKRCKIFFEKTPQNIHCAKLFLDTFKDSFFLHIVRNPLYVYKSLLNRNFHPYIAACSWLIDESIAYELAIHPRFITIRYEDLVKNPFVIICRFLKKLNIEYDPGDLENCYNNNKYRKSVSKKIKSWSINKYGISGNANKNKIINNEDLKRLNFILHSKVSTKYANEFDIPEVCFNKLINMYGYNYNEYNNKLSKMNVRASIFERQSAKHLFMKYLIDLKHGHCKLSSLFAYIKPVEENDQSCAE